ncbi:MAG: ATP-grasp domain-containing protein [Candidatus Pacebacteria bacterium]|nr:ATP-grasp domain-containing protein [Candidatus Paceibacterota bacterium]
MNVIILDGHLKSALAGVRSLGQKGIRVICAAERSTAMSLHSIYCSQRFIYPSPIKDKQKFVHSIIDLARNLGDKPLIYTFSDETFLPIAEHREKLEKYATIILPSDESIDIAFNKKKTLALAKKLEIPYVDSYGVHDLAEANNVAEKLTYPAVVKQPSSCMWKEGKGERGTAVYVFSKKELLENVSKIFEKTGEWPIIQEFIQGAEYGIEMLCSYGEPYALHAHKRIRSLKPSGGAAVVKETIFDTEIVQMMEKYAHVLMKELKWEGPVMVEFKMNDTKKQVQLMEINGRFWGSLPLAVFAGVDFPYLYYNQARGEILQGEVRCRENVVSRHFLGDIHHLLSVLFDETSMRALVYPRRLDALKEFFTPSCRKYDVFSYDDIKPFFMEIFDMIKRRI